MGATFDGSALSRSNRNATGESTPQQCRGFTLRRPNSGADTRDAKRRHCPREHFILLIFVNQLLTIGHAKHGEIGNWIDKQAFSPHYKLFCVERTE